MVTNGRQILDRLVDQIALPVRWDLVMETMTAIERLWQSRPALPDAQRILRREVGDNADRRHPAGRTSTADN